METTLTGTAMITIEDRDSYLFNPVVVASDWIAFFILFGSAAVIGSKLMQFRGPAEVPEDYYFG